MALMVGELAAALNLDTSKFDRGLDQSHGRFTKFVKGAAVASAAAAIAAGAGLLGLAKGAAEDEKAQAVLAKTLQNTAGATKSQVAAIEDYISKTGAATGVTDDQMRPALANLVRATKDVGKAQGLMGLAMDVSAGTGKDLGAVTQALAKAQNGSVGGLAKLGVATKDASGKTMTFDQIQKNLAKTFSGQAAAAAQTTAGKFDRLKLIMAEAGETIGGKVLPVLLFAGNLLLNRVVPAVSSFGSTAVGVFKTRVMPIIQRFGELLQTRILPAVSAFAGAAVSFGQKVLASVVPAVRNLVATLRPLVAEGLAKLPAILGFAKAALAGVGSLLAGTVLPAFRSFTGFLREHGTTVRAVAVGIGAMVVAFYAYRAALFVVSTATKVYAAVQTALNVVMSLNPIGIVVLALVGLAAGLVYAYKHSEKFRDIVNGVFGAVKGAVLSAIGVVRSVVGGIVDFFQENWKRLPLLLLGPVGVLLFIFKGLPGKVVGAVGNLGKTLLKKGGDLISGLAGGVKSGWAATAKWIGGIPGSAVRWIGSVGRTLLGKGKDLLGGMANGIKAQWKLTSEWIGGIPGSAVRWIGSVGRTLTGKGKDLIAGLAGGIVSRWAAASRWISGIPASAVRWIGTVSRTLRGKGMDLIAGLAGGVVSRWSSAARWISGIPASAGRWIGSVTGVLVQKGKDLLGGFWTGMTSKWGEVTKWVGGIAKWIKDNKGPVSLDGRLLIPAGEAIMSGFLKGLKSGAGPAWNFVSSVGGKSVAALRAVFGGNDATIPGQLGVLSGPNRRVFYQGKALDLSTYRKIKQAEDILGRAIRVTQGSYSTSVRASGSTHSRGGVFDTGTGGNVPLLRRINAALHRVGFASWVRSPSQGPWPWHVHAIEIGNKLAHSSAQKQVQSYLRGGTGLGALPSEIFRKPGAFRNGGWLMPGQLAYNETTRPEPILNQSQWDAMAQGGGRGVVLEVMPGRAGPLEQMFIAWLRSAVKARGGDVQKVLG